MRRALLVLGLALLGSLPPDARAQDVDLLRQGVVKVIPKSQSRAVFPATGFVVRTEAGAVYIVTAAHVVEGAEEVGIEFFNARRPYPARVLGIEGGDPAGLAGLVVEGDVPPYVVVLGINRDLEVRAGEPVTMIGFPRSVGVPWGVTRGSIVGRNGKAIVFSGAVDAGNSGGPLVKDDQVVGMITHKLDAYAYASPSVIVQYALESWGVKFGVQLRSRPADLHPADIARRIKERGLNHPLGGGAWGEAGLDSLFGHFRHDYEASAPGGDRVVVDHATGLMWQRSGSGKLQWSARTDDQNQGPQYVDQLNQRRYAGFGDWRLPTIEELASLLEARGEHNGFFIDPAFDTPPAPSLTADRMYRLGGSQERPERELHHAALDFKKGGLITFGDSGYVLSVSVRAVRSLKPGELRSTAWPRAK